MMPVLSAERARQRELKKMTKPDVHEWQDITPPKIWGAYAVDGRGHLRTDGGTNDYDVLVPIADFGDSLLLGGQVRFTQVCGGSNSQIFDLPCDKPQVELLKFRLHTHGEAAGGRLILVGGLQVRMPRLDDI